MPSKFRCTAKPLAVDSKIFIVIPGRIHFFHVTLVLLGATVQDFVFDKQTLVQHRGRISRFFLQVLGAEIALVIQLPSHSL